MSESERKVATTALEKELTDENRRLLDWIVAHGEDHAGAALFELSVEDGRFMVLACAPARNEAQLARTAAEMFVGLMEKHVGPMKLGELRSRGSVTVDDGDGSNDR